MGELPKWHYLSRVGKEVLPHGGAEGVYHEAERTDVRMALSAPFGAHPIGVGRDFEGRLSRLLQRTKALRTLGDFTVLDHEVHGKFADT